VRKSDLLAELTGVMSDGVAQDLLAELTGVMSDGVAQDLLAELTDVMSDGVAQDLRILSIGVDNNPWGQYQSLITTLIRRILIFGVSEKYVLLYYFLIIGSKIKCYRPDYLAFRQNFNYIFTLPTCLK